MEHLQSISHLSLSAGLVRLYSHLSQRRRWQLIGLIILMFLGAVAEMATLGAVFPFLALLGDQSLAFKYPLLLKVFGFIDLGEGRNIIFSAAVLFAIVAIGAAAIRMLLLWAGYRFTFALGADIGSEVYRRTLYQPFSFHVGLNTSEIIAGLTKVQGVVFGVINPLVLGLVALLLSLAILGVLISIDPFTAAIAGASFAALYLAAIFVTKRGLRANGKVIAQNEALRVQAIQEGLGGIRDVLIDGTQPIYIERFRKFDAAQKQAQASNSFIPTAPRYLIEAFGMVLIAVLAYWLSQREGGLSAAIPVLGALAIGAQKLLPQTQQIYYAWATLSGNRAVLADVLALLDQPIPSEYLNPAPIGATRLTNQLELRNVNFRYRSDAPMVVRNVSVVIPRGNRVGFIGKTGSGKSTLIDLIMGLLEPTAGHVEIDGQQLTSINRRNWQARIAHVPQSIYLADTSIAGNIAFGTDSTGIDMARVCDAAKRAQLADFIDSLPQKYQTTVGERGVRLSGGQRQRIGIARALYKHADVLILDEATSALDDETEKATMRAIETLGDEITVLMIAHRVSTLSGCDQIFELENGVVLREGTYQDLIRSGLRERAHHG